MNLVNILQKADILGVRLWGNRVSFASELCTVASYYSLMQTESSFIAVGASLSAGLFAGISGMSYCGQTTPHFYFRALKHIAKNKGVLDERFAQALITKTDNETHTGYCQQQGLYLAARQTGNLKTFFEVKEKYSNVVIPFF